MISEQQEAQQYVFALAPYFGMDPTGAIVGTSSDPGVEILKSMLDGVRYQQALQSGSLASFRRIAPRYSRQKSWTAFESLKRRTEELLRLPEEDDLGKVRPSNAAVANATAVLFAAFDSGAPLPAEAEVCTDADGAVRILWEISDKSLEIVSPFDENARTLIYFTDERDHKFAIDLGKPRLRRLFSWLGGLTTDFPK